MATVTSTNTTQPGVDNRRARHLSRIRAERNPRRKLPKAFDYLRAVVDNEPDQVLLDLVEHLIGLGDRKGVLVDCDCGHERETGNSR